MNLFLTLIGLYFIIEAAANLLYWNAFPHSQGGHWIWQNGRWLRLIFGFIIFGIGSSP